MTENTETVSGMSEWRPIADPTIARERAAMVNRVRRFFERHDVLMVDTPILSTSAVSDPNIESIGATLRTGAEREWFLQTSPEYSMKRLLAAGFPDIAQICKVFRDGESGRVHQPEFSLIEWYRLGFGLNDIMDDTERLLADVLHGERLTQPAQRLSYRDAFRRYADIDPLTANLGELSACAETGSNTTRDDRDGLLDLIMVNRIAPAFEARGLTFIHHYPASQAALARLSPDDSNVADRFEVFYGQLELANGYVELTDADEQARRFDSDQDLRRSRRAAVRPLDLELIAALQAGLPDCAGVAVGLDRLLMINTGEDDIRHVQHFPHWTTS